MAQVSLQNVSKVFPGNVWAIRDINLGIESKEFVVFVGPSGCGKSTTLRIIAGLEEATSGDVYIGDQLVNDVPPKDRNIAMVFQNYALYPHMSVYDNMAFGLKLRKYPKAEIDSRVKDAATILGIEKLLRRKPRELSGGQRQRIAIARAMLRKPEILVLDEATSSLDSVTERLIQEAMEEAAKGRTSIVIAHRLSTIRHADKIVVLEAGRVAEEGTLESLLAKQGRFFEYWSAQKFD